MHTQAQRAGPGPRGERVLPSGSEAAGPAGPRLVIREVGFRVGTEIVEAHTTLAHGSQCFAGSAGGRAGADDIWELAAAASVAALQQYLQQCEADPPTPQVQLLNIATTTTGIGQEVMHATVRLRHGNKETDLLGSALVRNDRCSTAVAAALDAVSRRLGLFCSCDAGAEVEEAAAPEPRVREVSPSPVSEAESADGECGCGEAVSAVEPRDLLVEEPPASRAVTLRERLTPARAVAEKPALGVTISPTSIRAAAVAASGEILAEARHPSPAGTEPHATLARACEAARDAIAQLNSSGSELEGIGLCVPGRLSVSEGTCVSCGEFPSWRDVRVTAPFVEEFGLPVALIGPTQALALAEIRFGAARGLSDLVFVRVGIDIDVAVILGGRPLSLFRSDPGQGGHIVIEANGPRCACGQAGCWQALANRQSLVARAVRALRSGSPSSLGAAVDGRFGTITPGLIVRMASGGDEVARRVVDETGRYLAIGLANLMALFNPEAAIVDSTPSAVGVALLQATEATLKSSHSAQALARCVLLSPELGDRASVLGAAAWASESIV
ncbi:MAG: ROK family protein [Armatimonadota bacterium]|nr:MAG: ROK family protein [Armatimonadota bacterium]